MLEYKNLTQEQQDAVDKWLNENDHDSFDCADNHRYAVAGNHEQESDYEERRCNGCCGFVDVELPLPDGNVLLFGFNYGH